MGEGTARGKKRLGGRSELGLLELHKEAWFGEVRKEKVVASPMGLDQVTQGLIGKVMELVFIP